MTKTPAPTAAAIEYPFDRANLDDTKTLSAAPHAPITATAVQTPIQPKTNTNALSGVCRETQSRLPVSRKKTAKNAPIPIPSGTEDRAPMVRRRGSWPRDYRDRRRPRGISLGALSANGNPHPASSMLRNSARARRTRRDFRPRSQPHCADRLSLIPKGTVMRAAVDTDDRRLHPVKPVRRGDGAEASRSA